MSDPVFLTVLRNERTAIAPEVEGVLVDVGHEEIRMTLDDGASLTFDASELRSALDDLPATRRGHREAA